MSEDFNASGAYDPLARLFAAACPSRCPVKCWNWIMA